MPSRLYVPAAATVDATGTASFTFGPVPLGQVWTGAVSVPGIDPAVILTAKVASVPWGTWTGAAPSPKLQAWAGETVTVVAVGLPPAATSLAAGAGVGQLSALLTGIFEQDSMATPIAPDATVPTLAARHLGDFTIAATAATGSFTVTGLQPTDHYLLFTISNTGAGAAGVGLTLQSSSLAIGEGVVAISPKTYGVLSVEPVFDPKILVSWQAITQGLLSAGAVISVFATPVEPQPTPKIVRNAYINDPTLGQHTFINAPALLRLKSCVVVAWGGAALGWGYLYAVNAFTGTTDILGELAVAANAAPPGGLVLDLNSFVAGGAPAGSMVGFNVQNAFSGLGVSLHYEDLLAA